MIWAGLIVAALHLGSVSHVCFGTECFKVEVAETLEKQNRGLMFRHALAINAGMLFVYPKESWPVMYMKNTQIPLDIIWLNWRREVVHIQSNVPVCSEEPCPHYFTTASAMYVLELNAGTTDRIALQRGDQARFLTE